MARKVIFSAQSVMDLADIYELIAKRDGFERGRMVSGKIELFCQRLGGIVLLGSLAPELGENIRVTGVSGMKTVSVMYRTTPDVIDILRISYLGRNIWPETVESPI